MFQKMLKINNIFNDCHNYKIIYLSSFVIQALVNFDNNNIFIAIFNQNNNNNKNEYNKLFLLQIAIAYRNTFCKLNKFLPDDKNLFPLIFSEIFFIPFLHNFDKVFSLISKKIDLVLFGNSEYISSIVFDLQSKEIIYDTGFLVQKNYRTSFLDFSKKSKIIDEINFFGQKLKNNYFKSNDKNLDRIENCIKLELRATFPKPLFIIKFLPILKGVLLIHVFHQYKLSKIQINSMINGENTYEKYKEIDAVFFDLYSKLEEFNAKEIIYIEKFIFEYFLILGSNIKEIGRNVGNMNKNLMTYKSKEYDLIYLNKQILQIIKDCIGHFYLNKNHNNNINDLIFELKNKFGNEYEKYKKEDLNNINNINNNSNNIKEEDNQTKSDRINLNSNINENINNNLNINDYYNNLNKHKNILELTFINFIKEFDLNLINPKKDKNNSQFDNNDNNIINEEDINVQIQDDYSNVNEYSNLNLSKDNLDLIKRNIITSATRANLISKTNSKANTNTYTNTNLINNNNDINGNIYGNYGVLNSETNNMKTEEDKGEIPLDKDEPFKIDVTSIQTNIENSKEESEFKSILLGKEQNLNK